MNAEIEHASPYGKAPGEKVPGQKRKIGPAAMRAWLERERTAAPPAPRTVAPRTVAPESAASAPCCRAVRRLLLDARRRGRRRAGVDGA